MGKYKGKFEDLFEEEDISSSNYDEFENEDSKYWIHRTMSPRLCFNPNYTKNNRPMILTEDEAYYSGNGKQRVTNCTSIDVCYNDEETKRKILKNLKENGLTLDDFELQVKNKLLKIFESYFSKGLYMADVYGNDLERTANQYSVRKMKKIINAPNFGFNGYRGYMDAGIILEIPVEKQGEIYEKLPVPIEDRTEYYSIAKISKVVSPKFIKGMVVKFGQEIFYIQNPNFQKNRIINDKKTSIQEKELYLYHTEDLINNVLELYEQGDITFNKLMENYLKRITAIYKMYEYYAFREPGFIVTDRNKKIMTIFNKLLTRYDLPEKMAGMERQEYYQSVQSGVNDYINNRGKKI